MPTPVRVRFAPSPTGPLHIGGVRTALYNYLFAKQHNGTFIVRIEDTDQTRYVPGAEDYIHEALAWAGLTVDEGVHAGGNYGPYRQSERKDLYLKYAEELVAKGKAYYAFDTPEELEQWRKQRKEAGDHTPQYGMHTRMALKNSLTLSKEEVKARLAAGEPYVIRAQFEPGHTYAFHDSIREEVRFASEELDDKVLFKADGMPTYHLANVVDDHLMAISHVIRGEEWLSSTPLHVFLYEAFGWEPPTFAHLPLILKPEGKGKLSKRDGDRMGFPVFPLEWKDPQTGEVAMGYREEGYIPEAFINMLAFLGWNPGTEQELFSLSGLIEAFSLERVGKGGARFDPDKAKWFNEQYLRTTADDVLAGQLAQQIDTNLSTSQLSTICGLMKERVSFVQDIATSGKYFFEAPTAYDAKMVKKKWKEHSPTIVKELRERFAATDFTAEALEATFKAYIEEKEIGFGAGMLPLRLVITGVGGGPSLFAIMEVIGKEEALRRIDIGVDAITQL